MSLAVQVDGSGRIRTRGGRIIVARPGDACCCGGGGGNECECTTARFRECDATTDPPDTCCSAVEYESQFDVSGTALIQFDPQYFAQPIADGLLPASGLLLEASFSGSALFAHECVTNEFGSRVRRTVRSGQWAFNAVEWRPDPVTSVWGYETYAVSRSWTGLVSGYLSTLGIVRPALDGYAAAEIAIDPTGDPVAQRPAINAFAVVVGPLSGGGCVAQYPPGSIGVGGAGPFPDYGVFAGSTELTVNTSGVNECSARFAESSESWENITRSVLPPGSTTPRDELYATAQRTYRWDHSVLVRTGCVPNPCGSALLDFLPGG